MPLCKRFTEEGNYFCELLVLNVSVGCLLYQNLFLQIYQKLENCIVERSRCVTSG